MLLSRLSFLSLSLGLGEIAASVFLGWGGFCNPFHPQNQLARWFVEMAALCHMVTSAVALQLPGKIAISGLGFDGNTVSQSWPPPKTSYYHSLNL